MAAALTFYYYPSCSTCRNALRWLREHAIEVEAVHIVESPPPMAVLKRALHDADLEVRRLFNTSGQSYRSGGFKERLPQLSLTEALTELEQDGKLIKRPLLVGDGLALVGFKAEQYAKALEQN